MRRPTCNTLLAGIAAAATVAGVCADETLAFKTGPSQNCNSPFPSFVWAGSKAGQQLRQNGYQHPPTDAYEVTSMVVDAAASSEDLELVVVVLSKGSSFSTSGVSEASAAAKAGVNGKPASMHARSATSTFPYTYPSTETLQMAMPLLATEIGAPVQEVSIEDVLRIADESGMLSDGKLDFIVVAVPDTATIMETDAAVRTVTLSLEEMSNGRFVLLWTGDFHGSSCGHRSLKAEATAHRRTQTDSTSSRTIKMTPDILAGLLTLLLFLFIMYVGMSCVGDIECPQHFNSVKPATGKEY